MLFALVATTFGAQYIQLDNAPGNATPFSLAPLSGEEGHWVAVRFAPGFDLSLRRIDAIFTQSPPVAPGLANCVVDIPHDFVVFTSSSPATPPADPGLAAASPTPPADPVILHQGTIDPIFGHAHGQVPVRIDLPGDIVVPANEHLFVAFELPGSYPDVTCLMMREQTVGDAVETEFWGFATSAPFEWVGLDEFGLTDKVAVKVSGVPIR